MKKLFVRYTNESPSFFKRIQAIGITLGSVGLALVTLPATIVVLPSIVITIAGYMVACGTVAAVVAKGAVKDANVLGGK